MKRLAINGRLLARNAFLNFVGQAASLVVGLITIPIIIHGLGTERFGFLSLVWVILGYFSIFDLGIGRAATKYVAEALGKGEADQVPRLVWTALAAQAILGILGSIVLAFITPLLVEHVLNIPSGLKWEAKAVFYLLTLSIPILLISASLSGTLEAAQRFDLVNGVRISSSISTQVLTVVGLSLGWQLPGIVTLTLATRLVALLALAFLNIRLFPALNKFSVNVAIFPRFLAFGGWVTVTHVAGPVLVYLERFMIGSLVSMGAVGYYTAPYEALNRLWIIPGSLATVLFPAFSALEGTKDRQRLSNLLARATKYIILVLGPIVVVITVFADKLLGIWLGSDFAAKSSKALQILAVGVLVNSLAHIPYALIQGMGRPDLTGKIHLLELPIYVGAAWLLVSSWGIPGAAAAWTFRVALDTFLLFVAALRVGRFSLHSLAANGLTFAGISLLLLAVVAYGLKSMTRSIPFPIQAVLFAGVLGLFACIVWNKGLDTLDKEVLKKRYGLDRK
jgi:O-antigen/teichoic acid export membrane protein